MALQHAAAVFLNQLAHRDSGRRQLDAGLLDAPADAETAQALAPVAAKAAEPLRAFLHDVAHPIKRLKVVFQRGAAEQADLRDIGRAHARLAAFAFDALDHGGLFAADVGARTTAEVNGGQRAWRVGLQARDFALQNRAATVVFVAQVDVARVNAHHLRGHQHALQETVRITLQVGAVLEGAGLTFVNIHRHEFGRRLVTHDAPFATGRKAGPAQATQAGIFHGFDDAFRVLGAR